MLLLFSFFFLFIFGGLGRGYRRGDGFGLGLAIVRAIADRHGAQVSLAEAEIGGLRVRVRFPAR